jgi:hypothetical protein
MDNGLGNLDHGLNIQGMLDNLPVSGERCWCDLCWCVVDVEFCEIGNRIFFHFYACVILFASFEQRNLHVNQVVRAI